MPSGPEDDNRDPKPIVEAPFREADVASIECELADISSQLDPELKQQLLSNIRRELDKWREGIDPQFEISEFARTTHGVNEAIKELLRFRNFGCIDILRYANENDTFTSSDLLRNLKNTHQLYDRLTRLEEMHLLMSRQASFSEAAERGEREQPTRKRRRSLYKITPRGKVAIEMIDERYPLLDRSKRTSLAQRVRRLFKSKQD